MNEELLGPAERMVVRQLKEGIHGVLSAIEEIGGMYVDLEEVDWEAMMLDSKKKEMVVKFAEIAPTIAERMHPIGTVGLMMLIMFTDVGPDLTVIDISELDLTRLRKDSEGESS